MDWAKVMADPCLQDLPYKIETDEFGKIVMTPASNMHGGRQFEIGWLIRSMMNNGSVLTECSVETTQGVKVADVAWRSDEFHARHGEATPYPVAPELCVEVVSPSNSKKEQQIKRRLYFQSGAKEVWFCSETGDVTFFAPDGELDASLLFPEFPKEI